MRKNVKEHKPSRRRISISGLLEIVSEVVGWVEDKVDDVKYQNIIDFAINAEHKIYHKVLSSDFAYEKRKKAAAKKLYDRIHIRKDTESNTEMRVGRKYQSDLVRSGRYFNLGELVSATKDEKIGDEVQRTGVLLEYTWMERASIDGKRVKENPEIIGKKNCREVPKEQYLSMVEKYYRKKDIDALYTP